MIKIQVFRANPFPMKDLELCGDFLLSFFTADGKTPKLLMVPPMPILTPVSYSHY